MTEKTNSFIQDKMLDGSNKRSSISNSNVKTKQRGIANVENTLNFMTGDITYEQLRLVPGISTVALRAKENAGDISIFQKRDYSAPLSKYSHECIAYWNIPLLSKFISTSGQIVPTRISSIHKIYQVQIRSAIKIARFLGLLPFISH